MNSYHFSEADPDAPSKEEHKNAHSTQPSWWNGGGAKLPIIKGGSIRQ
jgi:hypothetical protein